MFCPRCGEKIENIQAYCNRCGNYLGNLPNTNQVNNQYRLNNTGNVNQNIYNIDLKKHNKKMVFIGVSVGLSVLIIIVFFILIFGNSRYYFSTDVYDNNEINNNNNNEINNTNESKTAQKKGKYSTIINTDNTYSGMKIKNVNDAYELIVEDSVNQKYSTSNEIKDIENEIIDKYGITAVNLCELGVEFAREIENVFEKVYNEYPSVRGHLTNLSLVNASISESYIAAFMPVFNFATSDSSSGYPWVIKTQVLLNTTYFLNTERLEVSVIDSSNSGHFPPNTTRYSPVAHELGHYLSFLAMMKYYNVDSILLIDNTNIKNLNKIYEDFAKGTFSLLMIEEAYNNYKKDTNTSLTIDEWRATISDYAVARDNKGEYIYDETIAEAFHDVYLNEDNARDASKYVISVLKKHLES